VVVFETVFLQECGGRVGHLPPRRDVAARLLAGELLDEFDGLDEHGLFLGRRHRDRILVQIAVRTQFMTILDDLLDLLGKGLDRVARGKEAGLDVILLEQPQQAGNADFGREYAALDVGR
jgi:hypothetical protein